MHPSNGSFTGQNQSAILSCAVVAALDLTAEVFAVCVYIEQTVSAKICAVCVSTVEH